MRTLVVPGYGDADWYIRRFTKNWDRRYDLDVSIHRFGWSGEADSYDEKWQAFERSLEEIKPDALIGISAGASVVLRALIEHPGQIKRAVTVCGPVNPVLMNPDTLHDDYPLLERSLSHLTPRISELPPERVMTLRPYYDNVANVGAMMIVGATDKRIWVPNHAGAIGWTMLTHGHQIARFIHA